MCVSAAPSWRSDTSRIPAAASSRGILVLAFLRLHPRPVTGGVLKVARLRVLACRVAHQAACALPHHAQAAAAWGAGLKHASYFTVLLTDVSDFP
eukprot:CAMPEP_0181217794 /NCGR_PEP_ID=MMETSP1096-20121128/27343_1 /TAXON_ID=156174 ORGANISM="Chrysochromulina ericina, Strain CCMP281" /NCGR_SAMPLE_ID=MMETSP1096 /ASSEMBLY_ACC=CAM_ASM_000453 /LENGTH=94 /DNA_ID=CAMNT_0023309953 /DNA_START=243 /DNA_END=524 /DNA_ORIENTATION=+